MGIDARMLFTMTAAPQLDRLRQLQYELMERVGRELFWCESYENPVTGKYEANGKYPQPFLKPVEMYEQDGPDLKLENAVEVHLWCRYYGEGYERGPAADLVVVMLALLNQSDITAVYYGGDSGGVCAEPFTREKALAMLDHFCAVGGQPYFGYRSFDGDGNKPLCSYCHVPLVQNGSGGRYAAFYCMGCKETMKLRDEQFDAWKAGTLDLTKVPRFNGVAQPENKELF